MLTTQTFCDRDICSQCKHFKSEKHFEQDRQIVDRFCIDCYSDKVFIVTRFERKEETEELSEGE